MNIVLKISGIILILVSIVTMWKTTIWIIAPIKEIFEFQTQFNIHILFKIIRRFVIAITGVVLIIFALLLGFELISKY